MVLTIEPSRFERAMPVIEAELAKPYRYGTADCFFFGCRIADAMAGLDLATTYAGTYRTLLGAQRALRKRGHKSLIDLFAAHLQPCAPSQARFGDIVILQLVDGEHVGVCVGTRFLTKTEHGRSDHDLSVVKAAFLAG